MLKVLWLRFEKFLGPFTMFSNGLQKRDFLDIYLTTFFGIRNFGNTLAMKVIFFLKVLKFLSALQNCTKKFRKRFLFFR